MKLKTSIQTLLIVALTIPFFMSSCKKEVDKTIIQQDTIIQHDTVFLNYTYIENYNSGDNSELVSNIPIATTGNWTPDGRVIYSLAIPNLKEGDVISANAECEVDLGSIQYNATVFTQIILANNSATKPDGIGIKEISEANSLNITPAIHHWTFNQNGTYQITSADVGNKYVNFCAHSESGSSTGSPADTLSFPNDYGRLSIIVYKR